MLVIIAGEDAEAREQYAFPLQRAGLQVRHIVSLRQCLKKWSEEPADMVLSLQSESDQLLELVASFRRVTTVPLAIILEGAAVSMQLAAVKTGVDLFWDHPVDPRLCAAYCLGLLRRADALPRLGLPALELAGIKLDPGDRSVTFGSGEMVRLTQLEFKLLYLLMSYRGQVIPTEDLVQRVWGYPDHGSGELVRGLVSRLRRKLADPADRPQYIETISGLGYRFIPEA